MDTINRLKNELKSKFNLNLSHFEYTQTKNGFILEVPNASKLTKKDFYVARITGKSSLYGLEREFLKINGSQVFLEKNCLYEIKYLSRVEYVFVFEDDYFILDKKYVLSNLDKLILHQKANQKPKCPKVEFFEIDKLAEYEYLIVTKDGLLAADFSELEGGRSFHLFPKELKKDSKGYFIPFPTGKVYFKESDKPKCPIPFKGKKLIYKDDGSGNGTFVIVDKNKEGKPVSSMNNHFNQAVFMYMFHLYLKNKK